MREAPATPERERRASDRVRVQVAVSVQVLSRSGPEPSAEAYAEVLGEIVDVAVDGRGAALRVSAGAAIPVGGAIRIAVGSAHTVSGIVVSRLGLRGGVRIGVRIEPCDRHRVSDLTAGRPRR